MKIKKIKFWKDEESTLILDIPTLAKGSEYAYESDMLSNSDSGSDSNFSEYFPSSSTDNESSKSDTSGIFPPILKIHPGTYHKKKIILRKTCPRINFEDDDKDENLDDDKDENLDVDKDENSDVDYSPSTPVYDEDSKDRFEKLNILLKLQNQNNSNLDDDKAENHLYDEDEITSDEIRAQLNDIFTTSDEDI